MSQTEPRGFQLALARALLACERLSHLKTITESLCDAEAATCCASASDGGDSTIAQPSSRLDDLLALKQHFLERVSSLRSEAETSAVRFEAAVQARGSQTFSGAQEQASVAEAHWTLTLVKHLEDAVRMSVPLRTTLQRRKLLPFALAQNCELVSALLCDKECRKHCAPCGLAFKEREAQCAQCECIAYNVHSRTCTWCHLFKCVTCAEPTWETCKSCRENDYSCPPCARLHLHRCASCSSTICARCLYECTVCGDCFCDTCETGCHWKIVCEECVTAQNDKW